MKKLYLVTDLGPGDGGKGGVVHKVSHLRHAHTILKVGGGQGSHGVVTSHGNRFAFSHFGCGTFEGVRTHITQRMVILPEGILNEGNNLRDRHGLHDVFDSMTIDERALCAMPYHGIASRLKELSRGNHSRGTIGSGVGEAYRYANAFPHLSIHARDLSRADLRDRIVAVREKVRTELHDVINGSFLPTDRDLIDEDLALLRDDNFLDFTVERCRDVVRLVRVVDGDYLGQDVFARDGVTIVESSHGILTDHYHGFHPHTSAIRTLPCFTRDMVEEAGYDGEIVSLGVTRAYQIRHGAGPMPTDDPAMATRLLDGSHKLENRFQGKIRVGPLDLVLLRYAIGCAGGPGAFDGLAVTWFDQVQHDGVWRTCDRYMSPPPKFFGSPSEIRIQCGTGTAQMQYQEALGHELLTVIPDIVDHPISSDTDRDSLFDLCAGFLGERLNVDIRMVSFGPTERDKICK